MQGFEEDGTKMTFQPRQRITNGSRTKDFVLGLSDLLNDNQLICTGSSGLAIEAFYMMFRNKPGQKYFLTSGLGSMGYGFTGQHWCGD